MFVKLTNDEGVFYIQSSSINKIEYVHGSMKGYKATIYYASKGTWVKTFETPEDIIKKIEG